MATLLLSAAGAAIGGSLGGTVFGLSSVVAGRFVGAVIGRAIDQRLMGQGAEPVETGRVERLRIMGAGEGDPVARVHGRMRVAGQVIWATQFEEIVTRSGGGKGAPQPEVRRYSYRVSLAIALCEGEIGGVGRVWADGAEIAPRDLSMRVYTGSADQLPDPKMEAVEGTGAVPAYRGTAYVVLEDLALEQWGNRVPQFTFEVVRPAPADVAPDDPARTVRAVAMLPGSGEYALATTPVRFDQGAGRVEMANVNSPSGRADFPTALDQMAVDLPECDHVSLVVSWFGDDLRCGSCTVRPLVEQAERDGSMPWSVAGVDRAAAGLVPQDQGRAVYGGTPADASVVEAIREMTARGQKVMVYPFLLMTQMAGNGRVDPYTGAADQPVLPWRGRITGAFAPGVAGSPDGTAAAGAQVAAFFGTASAADFSVGDGVVSYSGPAEWSYRRFILHHAALAAAAGGVDAFCIGSEMRGLTTLRSDSGFPAVTALKALAAEVRAILGPSVKVGYAADWTEYAGHTPEGTADRYFHLDPLWSDQNVDFVGVDNYVPLSDWRDGEGHLDATWGGVHDLDYLKSNIEGGEGYDWFYHSDQARAAQIRTPITDGAHGEPWIWRVKDFRSWWQNAHFERIGGVRQLAPTGWEPMSKPIWFTELGCAAVDKGTNQPNKFLDAKSSESSLPYHSTGRRDDVIQMQYLRAMLSYWSENNAVSAVDGRDMVDMSRAHVWAWDARPWPWFPNRRDLWSDGANHARGHWLSGRGSARSLAGLVREICERSGLFAIDVSGLHGVVWGYEEPAGATGRAALQPLMLRFGFDAVDRDGVLAFVMRDGAVDGDLDPDRLALVKEIDGTLEESRAAEAEMAGRVRVRFSLNGGDFETVAEEAILPRVDSDTAAGQELRLAMLRGEGRQVAERWLAEASVARDTVRFALPPSLAMRGPGDVVRIGAAPELWRIDRVERGASTIAEAVRIDAESYRPVDVADEVARVAEFVPPVPVFPLFLDLPLMSGEDVPHAPHLAVTAQPWPGTVGVYSSGEDADYLLDRVIDRRAVIGVTTAPLAAAAPGRVDRGEPLALRLTSGTLESVSEAGLLAGKNLMAIGDGSPGGWELFQFRDAVPAGDGVWLVSHRLRGQLGTDAGMPAVWPAGSCVVLMDGAPEQVGLSPAQRGLVRHFRIGPARRPYADGSYRHAVHAFDGVGLRPLSPVHLRAEGTGDLTIRWIRRSRIGADSWDGLDVPLGEEAERYLVRVMDGAQILREAEVGAPEWIWSAADQAADGGAAGRRVEVAQVSAVTGPGGWGRLTL